MEPSAGSRWLSFVVPLFLALTACTGTPSTPAAAPTTAPATDETATATALPDIGPPCVLRRGADDVPLTERQAIEATGLAAEALTRPDPIGYLGDRLDPVLSGHPGVVRALLGYAGPALNCDFLRPLLRDQRIGTAGLTPRAARLRNEIRDAFGDLPMGGFAAGGVSTGHTDNSSHYEGRALDVFLRPHTDRELARTGWVLAQWLVARGSRLDVLSVIYRDQIWTIWASFWGWRDYEHPSGNTTDPVLRHLDHVHTAVVGGPYRPDED